MSTTLENIPLEVQCNITRYSNNLNKKYIKTDDEVYIDVYANEYSQTKTIDVSMFDESVKNQFEIVDSEFQEEFISNILNNHMRVCVVNGLNLDTWGLYDCDYCRTSIEDKDYYYCTTCYKDMCKLCYIETEELAIANGCKNYHKRKDALTLCKSPEHNLRHLNMIGQHNCDVCREYVQINDNFWSKPISHHNTYDMCKTCYDKAASEDKQDLTIIKQECMYDQSLYGSMLDWTPVIKNSDYDLVLLNRTTAKLNTVSLCSMDDHGRCGFYETKLSIEQVIEKLNSYALEKIKNGVKDDTEKQGGWEEYYNEPIKQLMNELNMQVHYG